MSESINMNSTNGAEIAVIGMAGRFPGAENIDEFWNNLSDGVESISFFSDDELAAADVAPDLWRNPDYVRTKGGRLENKYLFDAPFFGYTPKEAEIMDPQTRLLHECAWQAIEDAGYNADRYGGAIGIYAGGGSSAYWEYLTLTSGKCDEFGIFASKLLNDKDLLSTRIAYKLNLKGPGFAVQTACSTSLVSVHLACQAILNGECHMALAGGVKVDHSEKNGYLYQEGMITSPDGHCRPFDSRSRGTVGGEGVGVVLLKTLESALKDRDHIYAVIKGTAINNDGVRKIGFTAPSIDGQAEVIRIARQVAEVEPETIGYLETHGTATELGDVVEIEALKQAFNTDKKGFCAIGSVKSNLGHLDAAAGITGLIKTILSLKNQRIPASLHFNRPNPKIDFGNSPFYVNHRLTEWKRNGYPLRAGVSSFGIGGTNAHVILEEWPVETCPQNNHQDHQDKKTNECNPTPREPQLILLSARTQTALNRVTENLTGHLKKNPHMDIADMAYTLQVGRKSFEYRKMLTAVDTDTVIQSLSNRDSRNVHAFVSSKENRPVIFVFPGLGAQYVNMGKQLYIEEPLFQAEMDRCFDILNALNGRDFKDILYPADEHTAAKNTDDEHTGPGLHDFENAQLAVFILEYALAQLIRKWGIEPDAMIGYSFGEYMAALLSGVLSLEDALKLVVSRGKLVGQLPPGMMLSVPMPVDQLEPMLNGALSIAIDNGPSCIVAGSPDAVGELEQRLKTQRCMSIPMGSTHAIHSKRMGPIVAPFKEIFRDITLNEPKIPYISNLTGGWVTAGEVTDPAYWARHLCETVKFADGLKELFKKEDAVFIEVGPGRDLSALIGRDIDRSPSNPLVVNLLRPADKEVSDKDYLVGKIGQLWLYGQSINWTEFHSPQRRRRVPLPTYPFERQYFGIDHDSVKMNRENLQKNLHTSRDRNVGNWCYLPSWKHASPDPLHKRDFSGPFKPLVFVNESKFQHRLVKKMTENNRDVILVKAGKAGNTFKKSEKKNQPVTYTIDPRKNSHYEMLLSSLEEINGLPHAIVHCWNVTGERAIEVSRKTFTDAQPLGFFSLLNLVKAIVGKEIDHDIHITVLTDQLQDVIGKETLSPVKSPVLGLLKSIPQECPGIHCKSVDISLPEAGGARTENLVDLLIDEFKAPANGDVIAFRDNRRWVQFFDPLYLDVSGTSVSEKTHEKLGLRENGVYMITGGLGNIGLIFSELLVKRARARLILTGRSHFPPPDEWDRWLRTHGAADPVSVKIERIRELEKMGSTVLYFRADCADIEQMAGVVARAESVLGKINGVIHGAGITHPDSKQLMSVQSDANCWAQFQPKVYGSMVLWELFKNRPLDFCWMLSSVSCVLGGLGFGPYAAANHFMDVFARTRNRLTDPASTWFSLNWDGADAASSMDLFERIFSFGALDQLVISSGGSLQDRIDRWIKLQSFQNRGAIDEESGGVARPHLTSVYGAPRSDIEKSLAQVWEGLFGFDQIGIHDDFFELGGNSLKAITLTAHIKKMGYHVALTDILSNPTIAKIIAVINEKSASSDPEEQKEQQLLNQLECVEKLSQGRREKNIFIVHPMHGMLNQYKTLAEELGEHYNVYGIQARGLTPNSNMPGDIRDMVGDYIEQIMKIQPQGPYNIAGYCSGVTISYALVSQLERLSHSVDMLVFLDAFPILSRRYVRTIKMVGRLPSFVKRVIPFLNENIRIRMRKQKELKAQRAYSERFAAIFNFKVNAEVATNVRALSRNCLPLEIIRAPILNIRAALGDYTQYRAEDFSVMTGSKAALVEIPGDHNSILESPQVERLVDAIIQFRKTG